MYFNIAVNSVTINIPSFRECKSVHERKIFATRERSLFLRPEFSKFENIFSTWMNLTCQIYEFLYKTFASEVVPLCKEIPLAKYKSVHEYKGRQEAYCDKVIHIQCSMCSMKSSHQFR